MKHSGITLVELLISIVLLGMIVLGATAFDSASHTFFKQSRKKARISNELNALLDHMGKYIEQAVGDSEDQGITLSSMGSPGDTWGNSCTRNKCYLEVINEDDLDFTTPGIARRYEYDGPAHSLYFTKEYTGSADDDYTLLASRIVECEIDYPDSGCNGIVIKKLKMLYDTESEESIGNPAAEVSNVSFYSFSHSTN